MAQEPSKFLAVENSVVDLVYKRGQGDEALQKSFFKTLKNNIEAAGHKSPFAENPRAGDSLLITAEVFDDACIQFGVENGLIHKDSLKIAEAMEDDIVLGDQPDDVALNAALAKGRFAEDVRKKVFGAYDPTSGGSLANTFHTMQMAKINGQSLINGTFITCVGNDKYGEIFANDLKGHIKADKIGRQMVCHVFPVGSDRILIATPAADNPAEKNINAQHVADAITPGTDRIAVGGFLYFTGRYQEVVDRILEKAQKLGDKAPTLVLTAAAQAVAASDGFRAEFNRAARAMNTIVHANTGEFRRLLDMDTQWRKPFEKDFAGLHGHDLEEAKEAHAEYQAAKQEANQVALRAALELAHGIKGVYGFDLKFVVTNGSKGVFVVDPNEGKGLDGIATFPAEKIKKDQIANTVGAGDNFAAGYQLGDLSYFPNSVAVKVGAEMAANVIQIPEARLSDTASKTFEGGKADRRLMTGLPFAAQGGMSYLSHETLYKFGIFRRVVTFQPK